MSHAIPAPQPSPSPSPAATQRASRAASTRDTYETESSNVQSSESERDSKKTNSSSSDLSFMAALLSSIVNTNQNFSGTSAVASETEIDTDSSDEPAVKFGGTFNMDPSMLVLPEGIDAETLAALLEKSNGEFSAELLAALTPGIPATPVDPSVSGQTAVSVSADDPRLIASGLTPADMQALMDHLKSLAASMKEQQPVTVAPPVATVAIVPETPDAVPLPAQFTPVQVKTASSAAVTLDPSVAKEVATDSAAAFADLIPSTDENEFDPVEFRLALKPSRYSNAAVYQNPAPATVTPVTQTNVSVNVNDAIKGVMHDAGKQAPDVVMSSTLDGQSGLASSMLVSDLDCVVGATPLVATPAMTSGITNPVLQNVTAVQSHPATQAIAAVIANKAQQSSGSSGAQTLAIQLDPPELGRLQLKMKYERGEPLKVHVVLEKADTLVMFQRDAHALQDALNQAGVKTDSSSLSFSMAQDQNAFQQAMSDQGFGGSRQGGVGSSTDLAMDTAPIETKMPIFTDPKTGLTHYNILA